MWISEPMPVMTSTITEASVSSRKVRSTLKSPAENQVKTVCVIARLSTGRPVRCHTWAAAIRNDAIITRQATPPDTVLNRRRPSTALITKPANGRKGISGSNVSPLQGSKRFRVQRLAMAEQADDESEADRRLRRRDRHHEEGDDLAVGGPELPAERHKRQVHRVQHDFHRQQQRDQVAPQKDAGRSDREQQTRQDEIV